MTDSTAIFLAYVQFRTYWNARNWQTQIQSFAEFRRHRLEIASYYR